MTRHSYEYTFPVPLNGTQEEVFGALLDPRALEAWFAEHVEVEPEVGGAFRFWGRHTYGTPGPDDATQALVRLEPPGALSFSWRLLERNSEVTWVVEEKSADAGTGTYITVRHDFDAFPAIGRAAELIDDLWRIHTGNLCFFLNGETDMYRPDFSNPDPEVRCAIVIDAPPAAVFRALVEPGHIRAWFPAPNPVVEPRVGGKYGFGFSFEQDGRKIEPPPMEILEFVENEKLTITWPDWRMDPAVPDQRVSWQLEDLGGRTRLTLRHTGFTRAVDVSDYPFGWQEFLGKIRGVAESIPERAGTA